MEESKSLSEHLRVAGVGVSVYEMMSTTSIVSGPARPQWSTESTGGFGSHKANCLYLAEKAHPMIWGCSSHSDKPESKCPTSGPSSHGDGANSRTLP